MTFTARAIECRSKRPFVQTAATRSEAEHIARERARFFHGIYGVIESTPEGSEREGPFYSGMRRFKTAASAFTAVRT